MRRPGPHGRTRTLTLSGVSQQRVNRRVQGGRVQPPPVPRVKTSEFMCDPSDTFDVYTRVWRHVPVYLCSGNVSNVCGKWLRANVGASIHSPEPEPGHWSETLLLLRLRAPTLASCGLILPRGGGSHVSTPPRSTINPKLIVIKKIFCRDECEKYCCVLLYCDFPRCR